MHYGITKIEFSAIEMA